MFNTLSAMKNTFVVVVNNTQNLFCKKRVLAICFYALYFKSIADLLIIILCYFSRYFVSSLIRFFVPTLLELPE